MSDPSIISQLRRTLGEIEGDGSLDCPSSAVARGRLRRREVLPFGIEALDARLADGGLRLGGLHEVAAESAAPSDDAAATLFLAGVAARAWGPVLWVVRRRDLFAPGLAQAGLAAHRVLYAEAADDAELLALMEEGLRHRCLGAVIGEAKRAATASTRRLQLAAEGGRTIALLLKRHARAPSREGADPFAIPSAAITRWRVGSAPSAPLPAAGIGRPRWRLSLVRQRGGDAFDTLMEACDETGRLALPAALGDRAHHPRRAARAA